jgi:DNA mismatch repair ATPase MutS
VKVFLLHRDRDFDAQPPLPWNTPALIQDLELGTLFGAMAGSDEFVRGVVQTALLDSLADVDTIRYRQDVLRDSLNNAAVVRSLYSLATEAFVEERKLRYWTVFRSPGTILHRSLDLLGAFEGLLRGLRQVAGGHGNEFQSEGFTRLFATLRRELDDDYFVKLRDHLRRLRFREGMLVSAELGQGLKGANYVLRKPHDTTQSWVERVFAQKPPAYTYRLHPRDEAGARALSDLRDRGAALVANALGQSADHVLSFFAMLRAELAFYVGCLNLHEHLTRKGEPVCFPVPERADQRRHAFAGLYDVCLSLTLGSRAVGNDVDADGRTVVIITGANQGGKSTFLRSIGLAQLMMQCGMFVPAASFRANVCSGLFTHYKREEDPSMKSGKFDEELSRMSEIADRIHPNALMLLNESFAATNEREGSEIARQITSALAERGIKVFFVTHLYAFAQSLHARRSEGALFLRAERRPDGTRTFKMVPGEPLQTTYGEDLYRNVFG